MRVTEKIGNLIIENPKSKIKVREAFDEGEFKFFTSGQKIRFTDSYLCEGENIFIATGGKAHFYYLSGKASYSTDCYSITTKNNINTKYLYYFLVMMTEKINNTMFEGAALKHLQKNKFKNMDFHYPPIEIQNKIVSKLDNTFYNISKMLQLLNRKKTTLQNLNSKFLSALLNNSDINLKKIKIVRLEDICDIIGGGTPSKENISYYNGQIPWATVRDMTFERLTKTVHKITELGLQNSSSNLIPKNNIIIASRVGLGKVCILEQDTAINQDLRGIIPKRNDEIDKEYLFFWFKSISKKIISAGTGATVQGVKLSFLKSLLIPLPDMSKQKIIVDRLKKSSNILKVLDVTTDNITVNYEAFKSSILNQAFQPKETK